MAMASWICASTLTLAATAETLGAAPAHAQSSPARPTQDRVVLPSTVVPQHYDIFIRPDAERLRFDGSVRITIEVREPTAEIVLNAVDLELRHATIAPSDAEPAAIKIEPEAQTATLTFAKPLAPGTHALSIDYAGKIYESAQGLFVSRYDTAEGPKRMLLTQFEAVSARRFVPCWDEPARKATFSLAADIPDGELAVSNMPVLRETAIGPGRRIVQFERSPKMSSYLLFFALGEFERLEAQAGPTAVAVVARKGSAAKGRFALDSTVELLGFYNDYFGVPFPLPKLDLIAAPGAGGFSAMENWGAILYFEPALLVDPERTPESGRQRVFVVVAHELAHQWFGNLVTMEWWDNLWLNEGFASWMENKATDQFHPDWGMWLQSEADRQRAMRQDSKRTTHPVVQPVRRAEQADQAFDDITYRKGQAVVRMIESYIGPEAFRDGVRAYMQRHQFGNTVTDDLWRELARTAGKPIKEIADDFTTKPGVPLVSVETAAAADGTTVTVTEGRFAVDEAAEPAPTWHIPVSAAAVPSGAPPVVQLIAGASPTAIAVPGKPPIKVNLGQTSYFRTRYSEDALQGLADRFSSLAPADQLGLLYDAWALGEAGMSPAGSYLELARRISAKADPIVARQVVATLTAIDGLFGGSPSLARFRAFARSTLLPLFLDAGWERRPGEGDNVAVLREDLINALGRLEEPSVLDEARRRFRRFVEDPASLPAAIRVPVLTVAARAADAATYENLRALAAGAKDALEKEQLFVALASARDPALVARSLEIALADETPKSTGPLMLRRVAVQNPDLAWAFALAHLDALRLRLDALQRDAFVPGLLAEATDAALLPQLRAYIDEKVPAESRPQVERFYADLQFRLRVVAEVVPAIDRWLAEKAGSP